MDTGTQTHTHDHTKIKIKLKKIRKSTHKRNVNEGTHHMMFVKYNIWNGAR